jgi:uncharacterized protein YuzE
MTTPIHYDYDQDVDILYISFAPGETPTAAVEVCDGVLLRFNCEERRAVGVTLMDYSVLMLRATARGDGLQLDGLADLEPEWQEATTAVLDSAQARQALRQVELDVDTRKGAIFGVGLDGLPK